MAAADGGAGGGARRPGRDTSLDGADDDGWHETCFGYKERGRDEDGPYTHCFGLSVVFMSSAANKPDTFARHTHTGMRIIVEEESNKVIVDDDSEENSAKQQPRPMPHKRLEPPEAEFGVRIRELLPDNLNELKASVERAVDAQYQFGTRLFKRLSEPEHAFKVAERAFDMWKRVFEEWQERRK